MWGLPIDGESTGLFYRTDLFKAAGIDGPPTTWDEFQADAEKLTDEAKDQYGYEVFAPEAAYYWYPWLYQAGGDLLSEDGKEIVFDSPEAQDGGRLLRRTWPSTRRRTTSTPTPTTAAWPSPRARSACTWPAPGSPAR